VKRRPYADEPLLSKAVRRREFEREGDVAAPAAGCVEGASGASDAGAASAVAEPAVVEEEVDRLHGHPRAPLPLQYECISFPSFMSGLHLRARECHSRQERMVRSLCGGYLRSASEQGRPPLSASGSICVYTMCAAGGGSSTPSALPSGKPNNAACRTP